MNMKVYVDCMMVWVKVNNAQTILMVDKHKLKILLIGIFSAYIMLALANKGILSGSVKTFVEILIMLVRYFK